MLFQAGGGLAEGSLRERDLWRTMRSLIKARSVRTGLCLCIWFFKWIQLVRWMWLRRCSPMSPFASFRIRFRVEEEEAATLVVVVVVVVVIYRNQIESYLIFVNQRLQLLKVSNLGKQKPNRRIEKKRWKL